VPTIRVHTPDHPAIAVYSTVSTDWLTANRGRLPPETRGMAGIVRERAPHPELSERRFQRLDHAETFQNPLACVRSCASAAVRQRTSESTGLHENTHSEPEILKGWKARHGKRRRGLSWRQRRNAHEILRAVQVVMWINGTRIPQAPLCTRRSR
jgi:hypothetical protein